MAFGARARSNITIACVAILLRDCSQSDGHMQEQYAGQKDQPSAHHVALTGFQRCNYV
jgi:hypothetical protein